MDGSFKVNAHMHVPVAMRDGVQLSSDLYLPADDGQFPTVLMRTPYDNGRAAQVRTAHKLAGAGYACVVQDVRGRWDSEGDYVPFVAEAEDGYDTQEWIGTQPWSNGRIGMSGRSYLGSVQWLSAPLQSKYLTCLAPQSICVEYLTGLVRPGGAYQLGVLTTWGMRTVGRTAHPIDDRHWTEVFYTLPVIDMPKRAGADIPYWSDWLMREAGDPYWPAISTEDRWADVTVPSYSMGGWYDLYAKQTFEQFNAMRQQGGSAAARQSKLIMGPWPHHLGSDLPTAPRTGDIDFGPSAAISMDSIERRWFDHWLKDIDTGITDEPPLRLFIMGVNAWHDEHEWPLARTDWQAWYLHSDGRANSARGDGALNRTSPGNEAPDTFTYDPHFPVQTLGGANCCTPEIVPWGPYDQRAVEARTDVLCYTSEPLSADLEVTGPIKLMLHAATDGLDTDWTAKLVDVWPSGYALNLCDGIVRARHRNRGPQPVLLEPGETYEYEIDLGVTGNVFKRGHRIRLEVASSNFPRFDRNLNTGDHPATDTVIRVANQTVQHDAVRLSHLLLPVIPNVV